MQPPKPKYMVKNVFIVTPVKIIVEKMGISKIEKPYKKVQIDRKKGRQNDVYNGQQEPKKHTLNECLQCPKSFAKLFVCAVLLKLRTTSWSTAVKERRLFEDVNTSII